MLFMPDIETTQRKLMRKAGDLELRISRELELLNSIHQRLFYIQRVLTCQDRVIKDKSEAFYFVKIADNGKNKIKMKNSDAISWASQLHYSYPVSIMNPKSYQERKYRLLTTGLSVTVSELEKTKEKVPADIFLVKSRPVLYTTRIYREDQDPNTLYSAFLRYMETNPVEVEDELYIRDVATQREDGVNKHYMELWMPVKEN